MTDATAAPAASAETAKEARRQEKLDAYEAKTTWALSALALVYLFTFSLQVIVYRPDAAWYKWMSLFGYVLWLLFVVDLVYRFALAPSKKRFVKRNVLDIVTVAVPQFRALRALRAFSSGGVLSKGKGAFTGKAVASALLGIVLILWVGSLMVLSAERGAQGAEITSFGDSVWWSFETITTVGYGDFVPVTWLGRFFAVLIMIMGISVFGIVSAGLAATVVKQNPAPPPPATPHAEVMQELAELKAMVATLTQQLSAPPAQAPPGASGAS